MLPERAGTYALILRLLRPCTIAVGRLGRFRFAGGWYAYAGSARGPGGLAARLAWHLRVSKELHWHVDYLRVRARPTAIWYSVGSRKQECLWARALSRIPGATVPVPRFGASDCGCTAHLICFDAAPDVGAFARAVRGRVLEETINV